MKTEKNKKYVRAITTKRCVEYFSGEKYIVVSCKKISNKNTGKIYVLNIKI